MAPFPLMDVLCTFVHIRSWRGQVLVLGLNIVLQMYITTLLPSTTNRENNISSLSRGASISQVRHLAAISIQSLER